MATRLKPIAHEERLSLVEHLTELRTRIVLCIAAFGVVFAVCLWQDDFILQTVNVPVEKTANKQPCDKTQDPLEQTSCLQESQKRLNQQIADSAAALAAAAGDDRALGDRARALGAAAQEAVDRSPQTATRRQVTLGVGEPLTATLVVAGYSALLLTLPLLLYQLYAFVLPAFSPTERQVALPLMLMVPFLFYGGVVFAYYLVLPAAVDFLQNFNDENYDILLQARDYNRFAIMVMAAMGLMFQLPIVILAVTRMGILSVAQLRQHRRYAILIIAVVAMLLPGGDPVTMITMMVPILFLYEGSIVLASVLDKRSKRARAREEEAEAQAARERAERSTELTPIDPED